MSLYNGPPRGGNRGGKDQFNWESVKGDKDREFYLGHSVKATTGRWQKGKDVFWYTREKKDDAGPLELERLAVKQREEDLMLEAMGMKPKARKAIAPAKLAKHEMDQLMNGSIHDEEPEETPTEQADPTKGIGYKVNQLKAPGEAGHEVMRGVGLSNALPPPPPMPAGHAPAAGSAGPRLTEKQAKKLLKAHRKEAKQAKKAAKKEKKERRAAKKAARKEAEISRPAADSASDASSGSEPSSSPSQAVPPAPADASEPARKRQRHDSPSPPPVTHRQADRRGRAEADEPERSQRRRHDSPSPGAYQHHTRDSRSREEEPLRNGKDGQARSRQWYRNEEVAREHQSNGQGRHMDGSPGPGQSKHRPSSRGRHDDHGFGKQIHDRGRYTAEPEERHREEHGSARRKHDRSRSPEMRRLSHRSPSRHRH